MVLRCDQNRVQRRLYNQVQNRLTKMILRSDQNRVQNRLYTAPVLMVPAWFESPESQLSKHPDTIKNGSVSSWLRTRFWSQRCIILLPPLYNISQRRFRPKLIIRHQRGLQRGIAVQRVAMVDCHRQSRRGPPQGTSMGDVHRTSQEADSGSRSKICKPRGRHMIPGGIIQLCCGQNRFRNRLYTEPFLIVPGWFESPQSHLANHPGAIQNGSVYSRLQIRFWSQLNWIILPPHINLQTR